MTECSICLSDINLLDSDLIMWKGSCVDSIYKTKCGHTFHFKCIHDWLISNDDCPVCRTTLLDIEYRNNEIYDIFTEYCPCKKNPVWIRVTSFSNSPDAKSMESLYRDKDPIIQIIEGSANRNIINSPTQSRVTSRRKSMINKIMSYVNRLFS